ncbi:MAG: hypothetical protein K2X66_06635 [Cyanobacteria bacterium]|nr:hypothetical protein [Cyanobacteriota bacterium]
MNTNWDKTERRKTPDRRSSNRQGKYERRKNRCSLCRHFLLKQLSETEDGFCTQHQQPIASEMFACWLFQELL